MLSWAVLNKIQLFFLASFLVKKIMRWNFSSSRLLWLEIV